MLNEDPLEEESEYLQMLAQADAEAREIVQSMFGNDPYVPGRCHVLWNTKKEILKKKYGVAWKTPAEINPEVMFD